MGHSLSIYQMRLQELGSIKVATAREIIVKYLDQEKDLDDYIWLLKKQWPEQGQHSV